MITVGAGVVRYRVAKHRWAHEMEEQIVGACILGRIRIDDLQNPGSSVIGLMLRRPDGVVITVHYDRPSKVLICFQADDMALGIEGDYDQPDPGPVKDA